MSGLVRALWGYSKDEDSADDFFDQISSSFCSSTSNRSVLRNKSFSGSLTQEAAQTYEQEVNEGFAVRMEVEDDFEDYGFIDNVRELDDLRRQVQDFLTIVSEKDQELANTREQHLMELRSLQQIMAQSKIQSEARLARLQEDCARRDQELNEQRNRVQELEREIEKLKRENEQAKHKDEAKRLLTRLEEIEELCDEYQRQWKNVAAQLEVEQDAHVSTLRQKDMLVREHSALDQNLAEGITALHARMSRLRQKLRNSRGQNAVLATRVQELEAELGAVRRAATEAVNRVTKVTGVTKTTLRKMQAERLLSLTPDRFPVVLKRGQNLAGLAPHFRRITKNVVENSLPASKYVSYIQGKMGVESSVQLKLYVGRPGGAQIEEVDLGKTLHEYFLRGKSTDGCLHLVCSAVGI